MKKISLVSIALSVLPVAAQPARLHVQAELASGIKTKKAKLGDRVKAKTASPLILADGTAVPVSSPILGTVREVTSDSEGRSSVSISFDQVEIFGKKVPAAFFVQAAMMPGGPQREARDPATIAPPDVPHDRPMAGRRQTVQDSAEVQSRAPSSPAAPVPPAPSGATAAHTGSVIGVPGMTLQVDEEGRRPTKFELNAPNLELKPGLQLMLTLLPEPKP